MKHILNFNKIILSFILILLILGTNSTFCWWAKGHQAIADMAQHRLSKTARENINKLLQNKTLKDVAVCSDRAKEKNKDKEIFCCEDLVEMTSDELWHRVYIPLNSEVTVKSLEDACQSKNNQCIIVKLREAINILKRYASGEFKNISQEKCSKNPVITALINVIHFVGDLNCPMHSVDDNDNGGHDKLIFYKHKNPNDQSTKNNQIDNIHLHWIWDSLLEGSTGFDSFIIPGQMHFLVKKFTQGIEQQEIIEWGTKSIEELSLESFDLAKKIYEHYYSIKMEDPSKITTFPNGTQYLNINKIEYNDFIVQDKDKFFKPKTFYELVWQQLIKAGVKLAFILEDIFGQNL